MDIALRKLGTEVHCPNCTRQVVVPNPEALEGGAPREPNQSERSDLRTRERSIVFEESNLPRPLADPLRVLRKVLGWLILLNLVVAVVLVFGVEPPEGAPVWNEDVAFRLVWVLLPMPLFFAIRSILPRRLTNAFYLRSFRNDPATWPVRKAIQRALGSDFRLSGIRDPRRRWNPLVRMLLTVIFCFRYATPKYMNLEAGDDWKARLWRSLADARCAFVDLTDLTPFVEEEVVLAVQCLGLKRVLFIIDASRSADEYRELVAKILGCEESVSDVQVAGWDSQRTGIRHFSKTVREFAERLPTGTEGLSRAAYPSTATVLPKEITRAADWAFWMQTVAGLLLGPLLLVLVSDIMRWLIQSDLMGLGHLMVVLAAMHCYLCVMMVTYLIDCGQWKERLFAGTGFLLAYLVLLFPLFLLIPIVERLDQGYAKGQLRLIGLALFAYQVEHDGSLPPWALRGKDGRPLLSWRVAILPYLGEDGEELYRQFRLDQPWDSPDNLSLLPRMPKEFGPRKGAKVEPHSTFYRVLVGPDWMFHDHESLGISIGNSSDRSAVVVVEASQAVPWTKPAELEWPQGRLPPEFGGQFRGCFLALFGNGKVRALQLPMDPEALRRLMTPFREQIRHEPK
jgi:hypothetical protein